MDDDLRFQQLQNEHDSFPKKLDEMCVRLKDIHDKHLCLNGDGQCDDEMQRLREFEVSCKQTRKVLSISSRLCTK